MSSNGIRWVKGYFMVICALLCIPSNHSRKNSLDLQTGNHVYVTFVHASLALWNSGHGQHFHEQYLWKELRCRMAIGIFKIVFTTHVEMDFVLFVWLGFNATFNNVSVISRRSVLMVEEARVPGENHRPWAGNWQTLSRAMRVQRNPFLYGTNPGSNSRRIGDRIQWSVQVS